MIPTAGPGQPVRPAASFPGVGNCGLYRGFNWKTGRYLQTLAVRHTYSVRYRLAYES